MARASAVGTLMRRMTSPEKTPYSDRATLLVIPAFIIRGTIMTESTNCASGTIHALIVIGIEINRSFFARLPVEAYGSEESCGSALYCFLL